jgi:hypothetical protein
MVGRLVFHHQDGDLAFEITNGAYHLSPAGVFSCSIECRRNDEHDHMAAPHFALLHVAAGRALAAGQVLAVETQATPDAIAHKLPLAHLYAGQHYSPWHTRLTIKAITGHGILAECAFVVDDPNYYDERAKATRVEFAGTLTRASGGDIWNPL